MLVERPKTPMTEAEWLVCEDPRRMLGHVGRKLSQRKMLLFGAAIVRRHPEWLDLYGARDALVQVELYAEGQASERELVAELARLPQILGALPRLDAVAVSFVCDWLQRLDDRLSTRERERCIQADLLRDIAGNPFRPVRLDPAWLEAGNGLAVRLARVALDERIGSEGHLDNTRLAIVADALEDAGCGDGQVLSHLHGPGLHVRGCWVLDLLTGRE
jgi:hypothetical protein